MTCKESQRLGRWILVGALALSLLILSVSLLKPHLGAALAVLGQCLMHTCVGGAFALVAYFFAALYAERT